MLNHIIRLLAVVKTITNKTTTNKTIRAVNLLARQSTRIYNTIYQNRLALDYLLASERGVYEKLNLNNCCLQINDFKKKVIKVITDKMRKLARVPVQTWRGWDTNDLFEGCFSALGGFKTLMEQWV
jgi:hypothetical protein